MTPGEFLRSNNCCRGGIKLINMHESHDHTMLYEGEIAIICENDLFDPSDPYHDL